MRGGGADRATAPDTALYGVVVRVLGAAAFDVRRLRTWIARAAGTLVAVPGPTVALSYVGPDLRVTE